MNRSKRFLTFSKTMSIIKNYKVKSRKKQIGGDILKTKKRLQNILKNLTINSRATHISL